MATDFSVIVDLYLWKRLKNDDDEAIQGNIGMVLTNPKTEKTSRNA